MPKGTQVDGKKVPVHGRRRASLTRSVAPLAPLALALLVNQAVLPGGAKELKPAEAATAATVAAKCDDVDDFHTCHTDYPSGCSAAGGYDAYLNILKNQVVAPPTSTDAKLLTEAQLEDLNRDTPQEITKKNHFDFKDALSKQGEQEQRAVVGYLYYAKQSGGESSNCGLTDDDAVDYHIGIGFDQGLASKIKSKTLKAADRKAITQTSMIVEMTSHYRSYYHPEWTIDVVKSAVGKKVRVVGQLMLDSEHNNASQNCGYAKADMVKCWRASAWELHPVTVFEVCNGPEDKCTEKSSNWVALE